MTLQLINLFCLLNSVLELKSKKTRTQFNGFEDFLPSGFASGETDSRRQKSVRFFTGTGPSRATINNPLKSQVIKSPG